MQPSERDSAALASETADTASSSLHGDLSGVSGAAGGYEDFITDEHFTEGPLYLRPGCVDAGCKGHPTIDELWSAHAVDAAREDLAAELAHARATITELTATADGSFYPLWREAAAEVLSLRAELAAERSHPPACVHCDGAGCMHCGYGGI